MTFMIVIGGCDALLLLGNALLRILWMHRNSPKTASIADLVDSSLGFQRKDVQAFIRADFFRFP